MTTIWESDRYVLPSITGDHESDICVIGLGGAGLSAVIAAQKDGKKVIGIDAKQIATAAAGRNGGFLLAGLADFYHEAIINTKAKKLYQATIDQILIMKEQTPESVDLTGSLRIAHSEDEIRDIENHRQSLLSDGFDCDWYDGPEGTGIFIPTDGVFHPVKRANQLAKQAIELGANLFANSRVTRIGDFRILGDHFSVTAEKFIFAVDGNLIDIFPELSEEIYPVRLQMLSTSPCFDLALDKPVYTRWAYDYWQQRKDGRIALGGGRDVGGVAENTSDTAVTTEVQNYLDSLLTSLTSSVKVEHRWAATVSYTHSGLPIVREVRPGMWAVGAYNGTGNVLGPLLAAAVARDEDLTTLL
mgnify:FL=1